MIIDSHQHFWKFNSSKDAWIDDSMVAIRRDFLPKDLEPIYNRYNISGCIAVQADQSEKETEFLLECAGKYAFIKGVVGWVDLLDEDVTLRLAHFSKNNGLKGIRHILQAEPEGFMLRPEFQNGISKLSIFNLVYDLLVYPGQLEDCIELVKKFPRQTFVLDHIAKPFIKSKRLKKWKTQLLELARQPNVNCKLSGMVTESDWKKWKMEDFKPYLDVVFKAFGPHRILFGSDWPVCLLAANYGQTLEIAHSYIKTFSKEEQDAIMGGNAIRIYNLNI